MELTIEPAEPDDLAEVLSILDEAAGWLHSRGITQQWPESFSERDGTPETFLTQIEAGAVYLARQDGSAVGTFRLIEDDQSVWPKAAKGEALYVHSLAIRRVAANAGVALAMLDWAQQRAATAGCRELRLDCWAGNERLGRYYLEAGFEFRGEIRVEYAKGGSFATARYAKPVQ